VIITGTLNFAGKVNMLLFGILAQAMKNPQFQNIVNTYWNTL
jgi:hypothetical protein